MENQNQTFHVLNLPDELIDNILRKLPPKQLIKTSQVCKRFKIFVDRLKNVEKIWQEYGEEYYADSFSYARHRAERGMRNYDLYRSLTMWDDVPNLCAETQSYTIIDKSNPILNANLLKDGILSLHRSKYIEYCDINSDFKTTPKKTIQGEFLSYLENDTAVVLLDVNLDRSYLYLIKKNAPDRNYAVAVFEGVECKDYLLTNNDLYFVKNGEVYAVSLTDKTIESKKLKCEEGMTPMNLRNINKTLHVESTDSRIFKLVSETLVRESLANNAYNLQCLPLSRAHYLKLLRPCYINALVNMDIDFLRTVFVMSLESSLTSHVKLSKKYANFWIFASSTGIVYIYDIKDIDSVKPNTVCVKEVKLTSKYDPLVSLDVRETKNGHVIVVTTKEAVHVIKFKRSLKRQAPSSDN